MGVVDWLPADVAAIYGDSYYAGESEGIGYGDYESVAEHSVSWAAALVKQLRKSGKVLDIGCVDGHLLKKLGPNFEIYGIEVNRHMAERAVAAGVRVIGNDIFSPELSRFAGSFDVITAIAVFEHVQDFRRAFQISMSLLAHGGILLFEVPVISSTLPSDTWFRSSLEHIYYPTEKSLHWLIERELSDVLVGRELEIKGYAPTFIGFVPKDRSDARPLAPILTRLLDTSISEMTPDERHAKVLLSLIHAADTSPDSLRALSSYPAEEMNQLLLDRIASLWQLNAAELNAKIASLETQVRTIRNSTSWRITRPVRRLGALSARLRPGLNSGDPEGNRINRRAVARIANLLRRVFVLLKNVNRDRLRTGLKFLFRGDIRRLATLIKMHTEFRSRLRSRLPTTQGPLASVLFGGTEEVVAEESWPEDRPLVSVVIPCFNYGKYVPEAVESVLAQTFHDFEIIVVDGGSTDAATRDVLASLNRPRTRVLSRTEPRKTGDNRNFGISESRGKYICCLDADDKLRPTYLEKALFLLEVYRYDVVSTSIRKFGLKDDAFGLAASPDLADMLESNEVATSAVFRRALWEEAGGYRDAPAGAAHVHEDWQFWIRLAAMGARIANITGEQLFLYRIHNSGSLSSNPKLLPYDRQLAIIRRVNADVISPEAFERSRTRARKRLRSAHGARNLWRGASAKRHELTVLLAMPFIIVGGAERILSEAVAALDAAGHRVIVVTTLPCGEEFGDLSSLFESVTSEIYHLPRFLVPEMWLDFIDYLIEAKRVDIIWVSGSAFVHSALPRLKHRYPHIRVVDQQFNAIGHTTNNRKYAAYIDLNIVENSDVERWLTTRGETSGRIKVIPSGVDLVRFAPRPKPDATLSALGIDASSFVVGFSGRLAEEKAPLSFIRMAALTSVELPVRFIMTGAGPLETQVREEIKELKLGDRLIFQGMVTDVREYLACYDVLVLPSTIDGRPVVVMEALAMGIPVIASRVGGLPELIVHGETGFLCDANDIPAFVSCIIRLRSDSRMHANMRKAARVFAEHHLNVEAMRTQYAQALLSVVGRRATTEGGAPAEKLIDVA